jgi:hypothetical protein
MPYRPLGSGPHLWAEGLSSRAASVIDASFSDSLVDKSKDEVARMLRCRFRTPKLLRRSVIQWPRVGHVTADAIEAYAFGGTT